MSALHKCPGFFFSTFVNNSAQRKIGSVWQTSHQNKAMMIIFALILTVQPKNAPKLDLHVEHTRKTAGSKTTLIVNGNVTAKS